MRLQKKSISKVSLLDLLRRRKTTLEKFLEETGIVTYDLLVARCASGGMTPPTEEQFLKAKGNPVIHEVSSPTEGIVVVNPPEDIKTTVESGTAIPIPLEASPLEEEQAPQEAPEDKSAAYKKKKKP